MYLWVFPCDCTKAPTCNAGDTGDSGFIPGFGRSPGGGNENPLQYSCLGNPLDRGDWWAMVLGVPMSQTWLITYTYAYICVLTLLKKAYYISFPSAQLIDKLQHPQVTSFICFSCVSFQRLFSKDKCTLLFPTLLHKR